MFKVNGIPILSSEIEILEELRRQLQLNGLNYFNEFKIGPDNIQFNCPIHADGQERKPSCGVSTVDKGMTPAGTVHCFTCGYVSTLSGMISHLFGFSDPKVGDAWLARNFLTVAVEDRKPLILNTSRGKTKQNIEVVTEAELNSYRYTHPYLYQRRMTDEIIEKFDLGYDKETDCITFPVWDMDGNCVFIGRRSVKYKFFKYPRRVEKPIYGANFLTKEDSEVIVCESVFNALTCWVYGKPAVALLGTGSYEQFPLLQKLPCRKLILALDPDDGGRKGTLRIRENLKSSKVISEYILPKDKDINDLDFHQFRELREVY